MPTKTISPKTSKTTKELPVNAQKVEVEAAKFSTPDDILHIALAKKFPTKDILDKHTSDHTKPGDHKFKGMFIVSVEGVLRKGEDYEMDVPNKIDWTLAFAVAMNGLNDATKKVIMKKISLAHRLAIRDDARIAKMVEEVKMDVKKSVSYLKKLTHTKAEGKITFPELEYTVSKVKSPTK
jgi:asparagine synthetase A